VVKFIDIPQYTAVHPTVTACCVIKTLNINVTGTRIVFSGLFWVKKAFLGVLAPKILMPRLGTRTLCRELCMLPLLVFARDF
jgi:hypothetical protein